MASSDEVTSRHDVVVPFADPCVFDSEPIARIARTTRKPRETLIVGGGAVGLAHAIICACPPGLTGSDGPPGLP